MAYMRWSSGPWYIYWRAPEYTECPDKNSELLEFADIVSPLTFTYEELKLTPSKCIADVLTKQSEGASIRDIKHLLEAIEDFISDVENEYDSKSK